MKKNQINSCLLIFLPTLFYLTSTAQTLEVTSKIVQSPYYDAKALYYAIQNYSAYPVFIENKLVEVAGVDTIKKNFQKGKKNTGPSPRESAEDATKNL